MKNLIEIGKLVTKKKVRKIEIFDDHSLKTKNSKFNEFYEALLAGKFKNDRDAATYLYGCSPTDDKYRQLKSRFRKRLLNTLFFLDVNLPATSSYDRAYYSCNKDWTLVKILLSNHADLTAQQLARQILTTALKYQFADVIVNAARILRDLAAREGDEKGFDDHEAQIRRYGEVVTAEMQSEAHFQRVTMRYQRAADPAGTGLMEALDTPCNEVIALSERYDSPVIQYNMYLVWILRFELLQDYGSMLEVAERAGQYIETHPRFYQTEKLAAFRLKQMAAYLHLRQFEAGQQSAEKCLNIFGRGSATWFAFLESYLLLAVHTQHYIQAVAIYQRATVNSKFKKLDYATRERWKVYEVYQHYLIEAHGDTYPVLLEQRRKPFRLNRFLQEPLLYPKDLRILSVHMNLLQLLFLLEKRKFNQASDRVDRLRSYAHRQLKRERFPRILQLIRNLYQLARVDFQTDRLSDESGLTRQLEALPFAYRGQLGELEVIPFERIWATALERGRAGTPARG